MPIFSYECPYGHVTDEIFMKPEETIPCHCGEKAKRIFIPTANLYVPSIHQATYWTDRKREIQVRNNRIIARKIRKGEPVEPNTKNVPREFAVDLDRRIRK